MLMTPASSLPACCPWIAAIPSRVVKAGWSCYNTPDKSRQSFWSPASLPGKTQSPVGPGERGSSQEEDLAEHQQTILQLKFSLTRAQWVAALRMPSLPTSPRCWHDSWVSLPLMASLGPTLLPNDKMERPLLPTPLPHSAHKSFSNTTVGVSSHMGQILNFYNLCGGWLVTG